jgi:periplasmic protein TonB
MRFTLPPYLLSSIVLHGAAVTWLVATGSAPRFPKPPHTVELVTLPLPPAPQPLEAPPPKVPEPEPVKPQPPKPRAPTPPAPEPEKPAAAEPEAIEPAAPEPLIAEPALAALGDSALGLPLAGTGRGTQPAAGHGGRSPSVAAKPSPPKAPRLVRLADLSRKPQPPSFDGALRANYPETLRRQGTEGQATLRLTLSSRGRVVEARVLSQSHPEFATACRRTLLGSQWSVPLDGEGRPTGTELDYRCRFRVGS